MVRAGYGYKWVFFMIKSQEVQYMELNNVKIAPEICTDFIYVKHFYYFCSVFFIVLN